MVINAAKGKMMENYGSWQVLWSGGEQQWVLQNWRRGKGDSTFRQLFKGVLLKRGSEKTG